MANRVTQAPVEVLEDTSSTVRVTQAPVEGLTDGTATVRLTQAPVEGLTDGTATVRLTQAAVEVLVPAPFTFSLDAFLRVQPSFTLSAILRRAQSATFTLDAYILIVQFHAPTPLDAVIKRTYSSSLTLDAVIPVYTRIFASYTLDAVIKATGSEFFLLQAWIKNGTTGVTGEDGIHIKVAGRDITDDVIFETAEFTMLVNGAPGNFRFRVRDVPHARDFTTGAEITVDINGYRKFGGYLTNVNRLFAFPVDVTTTPAATERLWQLSGVDYNILFNKRIVRDKADPANVMLRSWPTGSHDDDVIRYIVRNYTDLLADGMTYEGLTHVGTPNPDYQGVIASGGLTFGDAMREINRLISAVFYIDPYKDLHWVDVDIPDAAHSMSDNPAGGTEVGYRDFRLNENGSNLINDALVWGAGGPNQSIVFARAQDAISQSVHGLWQWGDFDAQLYKQASVDKRADSVVFGTAQSKRGGKDDQVSWTVTTYDPTFSVGEKVQIESEVWGMSDVVPIRRMTLTFPTPTDIKLDLVLSHEIDEPWNLFEFYFPKFGFDFQKPNIHLPTPGGCGAICQDVTVLSEGIGGGEIFAIIPPGAENQSSFGNIPPSYVTLYAGATYRVQILVFHNPNEWAVRVGAGVKVFEMGGPGYLAYWDDPVFGNQVYAEDTFVAPSTGHYGVGIEHITRAGFGGSPSSASARFFYLGGSDPRFENLGPACHIPEMGEGWGTDVGIATCGDCGVTDSFSRTVASGFGTSDAGIDWDDAGHPGLSVSGGTGNMPISGNTFAQLPLADPLSEATVSGLASSMPVGAVLFLAIETDGDDSPIEADFYQTGHVDFFSDTDTQSTDLAFSPLTPFNLRITFTSTTTADLRIWQTTDPVPTSPTLSITSSSSFGTNMTGLLWGGATSVWDLYIDSLDILGVNACQGSGGGSGGSTTPTAPGQLYGVFGEGATRIDSTHYQLTRQILPGSSEVFVNGEFQRPGIAREYTENPTLGIIEFNDAIAPTSTVWVVYYANGVI